MDSSPDIAQLLPGTADELTREQLIRALEGGRKSEQRQAFLLKLSDALRPLADPVATQYQAVCLLGEFLDANRVGYAETQADKQLVAVTRNFVQGVPGIEGVYRYSDYGQDLLQSMQAGKTVVRPDIANDPALTDAEKQAHAVLDLGATLNIPLVKQGHLVAILFVHYQQAHPFSPDEISLAEEVAERTWAFVERARSEQALSESEAQLSAIVNQTTAGISRTNTDGTITFANDRYCALLGYEQAEIIGRNMKDLTHPDDLAYNLVLFDRLSQTGESFEIEKRYIHKNGSFVWVHNSVSAIRNAGGIITQLLAVSADITDRKRAEATVRRSEAHLAAIFQAAEVGISEINTAGRFIRVNDKLCQILNRSRAELTGLRITDITRTEDLAASLNALNRVFQTGTPTSLEKGYLQPNGQIVWANSSLSLLANNGSKSPTVLAITADLTQRRQAEDALRQREAEFKTIAHAAPALVWIADSNGDIVFFNQRWYEFTGQSTHEADGSGWINALHPDDWERLAPYWQHCQQTGEIYEGEARYRRYDGQYRWHTFRALPRLDDSGQIQGWYGLSIDTHEAKESQQALQQSEERIRIAVEAAELATWEWNLQTNEMYWNQQHFILLGMPTQDSPVTTEAFFSHIYPEDLDWLKEELTRAIEQCGIYDADFRIVRPDGSLRWVSGYGRVTEVIAGRSVRMSGVMFDLTDRKLAEETLKQADRRKDEFLAMLAHELRNPMATISNGLQILSLIPEKDAMTSATVAMMNRQVEHLVRLIDDLLDVSRISRGHIELRKKRLNLVDLVHQAAEAISPLYQQQEKSLQVELPKTPVYLEGDFTRLTQVVTNLLTNGVRYTDKGGKVWLSVSQQNSPGEQQEAIIRIRDNGIGLAADQLSSIFELFVQVDTSPARSQGGLGLGLTLVKQLVTMHGGRIEVYSEGLGKGSTFTVYLPVPDNPPF